MRADPFECDVTSPVGICLAGYPGRDQGSDAVPKELRPPNRSTIRQWAKHFDARPAPFVEEIDEIIKREVLLLKT